MDEATIRRLYREEQAGQVLARLPGLVALFAVVFTIAWVMEYLTHPERMWIYATTFAVELVVCGLALAATRTRFGRRYVVAIASATCVTIFALVASYHIRLGGESEIMAFALMFMVTGMTVGLPLGASGQLPIALAAVVAYLAAVLLGARSVVSVPLITLGMASMGALTVAASGFLDRSRYTSFRRAEELRQTNALLATANEAKNMFLANVSHELRTPLNVILGYTELMLDGDFGPLPAALQEPLQRVVVNTRGLVHLIGDLLDLSRIEAGRLEIRPEDVELAPLFREVSGDVEGFLENKAIRFVPEEPGDLWVSADRDRLRQVLLNLLSNAAKFTAAGEVRLRAVAGGEVVDIEVADTGVGIAPGDLAHIFEPFHRAANAKQFGGVGIGLSISERLVRAMGGEILVSSEIGVGSRFCVRLRKAGKSP